MNSLSPGTNIVWIVFISVCVCGGGLLGKLSGAGSHNYGTGSAEGIPILLRRGLGTPVT